MLIPSTGPGAAPVAVTNTIATLTPLFSPYYSIITVSSPNVFITEPWQSSTALIIFPGGRDLPYCQSLNGSPNAAISAWVRHRGGKVLGLCAGGYYASKRCEFEIGDKYLEVAGSRELGFFPGTSRGTAFEGFIYDKEDGAKASALKIEDSLSGITEQVKVYCNGGGIFVDADSMADRGVTVLARFKDKVKVEGGNVVAVHCKVGNGAAVLLGVHPEYSPQ
jgi:biotin--protein ligase